MDWAVHKVRCIILEMLCGPVLHRESSFSFLIYFLGFSSCVVLFLCFCSISLYGPVMCFCIMCLSVCRPVVYRYSSLYNCTSLYICMWLPVGVINDEYGSYWWNQKHHILPFDLTNIYFLSPTRAQRVLSFKTDKKYRTTDKQAISLDVGNFHNKSDRVCLWIT